MTKREASKARKALDHLIQELPGVLEIAMRYEPMLKAYLSSTPRTCGNPTCRCASGEKHPAWVVRIPDGSRARSRSVPESVFRRLMPLAREYRSFRKAVVRVRRLMREADEALRVIESARMVDAESVVPRKGKDGK